jgi:hypothetical protein
VDAELASLPLERDVMRNRQPVRNGVDERDEPDEAAKKCYSQALFSRAVTVPFGAWIR